MFKLMLGHHRPASEKMVFRWRVDDGLLLVVFGSSLPHYLKKRCKTGKTFWIRGMQDQVYQEMIVCMSN